MLDCKHTNNYHTPDMLCLGVKYLCTGARFLILVFNGDSL